MKKTTKTVLITLAVVFIGIPVLAGIISAIAGWILPLSVERVKRLALSKTYQAPDSQAPSD
jgi:hypothetical protein